MEYRRFGRTELQMPVFSCGGMRYQFKWQDVPPSDIPAANQANLDATIRRALELGITHVETARGYGTSELQLGRILPQLPREKLIVQTKVSPKQDVQEFEHALQQSLNNLNLDYVDLLGIHGINTPELLEQTIRPGGCLELVRKYQQAGRIRFVGFSTHGPTDVITQTIETGEFDYVNLHWYYILQENWPAILAAQKQDMGVFIISPSDKGGRLYDPPQRLVDLCAPLSPMVFNDLFCLSRPEVHTLSLGAAQPSDFDEHLKVLSLLNQAQTILPEILERLAMAQKERLGADWCDNWQTGLPPWEETPGQINIKRVLWLRNLAIAFDLHEFSKWRYGLLGNGSHWFPGEKAARIAELDLAACLANSPFSQDIPAFLADAEQRFGSESVQRLSKQTVAKAT
ncbi:MAG: aldo/keto reductase [Cyanobacteria bacterium P01_H01_bin.15]